MLSGLADALDDIAGYGEARASALRGLAEEIRLLDAAPSRVQRPTDGGISEWTRETKLAEATTEARVETLRLLANDARDYVILQELRARWPWWRRLALACRLLSYHWPT